MDPDTQSVLRRIGRRVAELRRSEGMTQEQMATALGHSLKYQQRIEAGRHNLSVGSLTKLAGMLGVDVGALFTPPKAMAANPGRPRRAKKAEG